jgi:glutamate-5-semialdehyde dehydrogenase
MDELLAKAESGKSTTTKLAWTSTHEKNSCLERIAEAIDGSRTEILTANALDIQKGEENGLSPSLLDRLRLTAERIDEMLVGITQVQSLPDPIGESIDSWTIENGLLMNKIRVPLGLVGIIYEARPNVTVDASVLCLKTGNAVLLRGSSSALESNKALVAAIQKGISHAGLPAQAVQLLEDVSRASADRMLKLSKYLDVVIPRGSAGLIQHVVENASVPVLETGAGNCHVYIHEDAAVQMANEVVINAKTQRPSVCNAAETLLVHTTWAASHLPSLIDSLVALGVDCRGCERTMAISSNTVPATESDWETEFHDLIFAIKIVDSLDEAIAHVNKYGTRHSEAIITDSESAATRFQREVDAAAVYHNASTRFTDGFVFGFGAEIGISTQKLHARGPMGLPEMTSYKFMISGNGQVRQ